MTDQLEDRLSRVLAERARTVEEAPGYQLVPVRLPSRRRAGPARKLTGRRLAWPLIASAAAVTALVVVLVNGGFDHRHGAPTLDGATCSLPDAPRFTTALDNGRLPAGARVLSGGVDGTSLVSIDRGGATRAVELIDRAGGVEPIWTAAAGERDVAVANPSGAITADAVTFVLDPAGSGPSRVIAASRAVDFGLPAPAAPAGYRFATDRQTAPVSVSDGITVALEISTSDPADERIESYWPADGRWTAMARPSHVSRMLAVGGNVVMLSDGPNGTVADIRFTDPQYRPSTLLPAARNGFAFSSDGTTMTWLRRGPSGPALLHWSPGEPSPTREPLPARLTPVSVAGRFAVVVGGAARGIVDTANGSVAQLPAGVNLIRVDGPIAVLSQQAPDGIRYSRVPTSVLTC